MYNEFDDREENFAGNDPETGNQEVNVSETEVVEDTAVQEPVYNQDSSMEEKEQETHKESPTESFYHYSYDRTEEDREEQPVYGNYSPQQTDSIYEKPKKKKGMGSKIAVAASVALVFGVVSSAAFQVTGYVGGKVFPQTKQSEAKISTTGTVNNNVASGTTVSDKTSVMSDASLVAKASMPSIVSITNKSVKEVQNYFFGGSSQQEEESSGSGIIVAESDTELLIATNNHVVEDAQDLSVCFTVDVENQEEKVVKALVKGTDPSHDLAVVAVALSDIPSDVLSQIKIAVMGDSDNLEVGQQAIAIGNALGYGQSLTSGVISALDREVTVQTTAGDVTNNLIQTDAAINFGNSGGALLDSAGNLIGINSVKAASTGVEGMGYAIPINTAKPILDELMNQTTRELVDASEQGFIGITPMDVIEEMRDVYGLPSGAMVKSVTEDSPADEAGLKKGDIITKMDGVTISSANDLLNRMQYYKAGEKVELEIQSAQGTEEDAKTITITLGNKSEAVANQSEQTQQTDSYQSQDGSSNQNGYSSPYGNGIQDFFQFDN